MYAAIVTMLHSRQFPSLISTNQANEIAIPRFESINRADRILSERSKPVWDRLMSARLTVEIPKI